MRDGHRVFAVGVALVLVAACSASRGRSSGGSSTAAPAGSAVSSPTSHSSQKFGTLASPCGPGHATGVTDQGVTSTAIHVAYGDDRGFPGQPGLNKEMGDAVRGMIKWCNDQGGILGRQVVGDFYDAAVTEVNSVMQQACKSDFMLVGEGWALDNWPREPGSAATLSPCPVSRLARTSPMDR